MRSMTGFGRAIKKTKAYSITIELLSVNKRNFEVVLSCPREWQSYEIEASQKISESIERGRIRVNISVELNKDTPHFLIDHSTIVNDTQELAKLMTKLGQELRISAEVILELHKLRRPEDNILPSLEEVQPILDSSLLKAKKQLLEMKKNEGEKLAHDMSERIASISQKTSLIQKNSESMSLEWRNKLLQRLRQHDLDFDVNDERVLKEVTLFAEKCDISEEIIRIKSHLDQLSKTLEMEGSIGRKIEFLLQELGRELNTICSKSTKIECTQSALDARAEIEKLREQALNVE